MINKIIEATKTNSLGLDINEDTINQFLHKVVDVDSSYLKKKNAEKVLGKDLNADQLAELINTVNMSKDPLEAKIVKIWILDTKLNIDASLADCLALYNEIKLVSEICAEEFVSNLAFVSDIMPIKEQVVTEAINVLKEVPREDIAKEKLSTFIYGLLEGGVTSNRIFMSNQFSNNSYAFDLLSCLDELGIIDKYGEEMVLEVISLLIRYEYGSVENYFLEELFELEEIRFIEFVLKNLDGEVAYWVQDFDSIKSFISSIGDMLSSSELNELIINLEKKKK